MLTMVEGCIGDRGGPWVGGKEEMGGSGRGRREGWKYDFGGVVCSFFGL